MVDARTSAVSKQSAREAAGLSSEEMAAQLWKWLDEVPDPEIPVLSIVDLGIVRGVAWDGTENAARITMTPTYSGCPATEVIQKQIREHLHARGVQHVHVSVQLSPSWTTDWMSESGREKLLAFGIAPPQREAPSLLPRSDFAVLQPATSGTLIPCPLCGSHQTERLSQFGSTPCKSLHRCLECLEPFDHFKCH